MFGILVDPDGSRLLASSGEVLLGEGSFKLLISEDGSALVYEQ